MFNATGTGYPVPRNLSYFWNFGVLNGTALARQIVTGILLAMHYAPNTDIAFASIKRIMRDVNYGWLIRYAHLNGASLLIPCVLTLGYCGGPPAEQPYLMISQVATAYYFAHFLVILPLLPKFEKPVLLPHSIMASTWPETPIASKAWRTFAEPAAGRAAARQG